jgi:3-hydroxyisobutyrate dehydrogenase-like beta-hydroxyacid dehydrogenase
MASELTVAFLGLGAMGGRMARRLLEAGQDLVVWNRTADRATELASAGARTASSPAEAARQADVVMTMLATPAALREVVEASDGLAEGVRPGTAVFEMSTVGPEAITWLRSALPEDVALLDAPVLGSLTEVEAGTLRVFVGGQAEQYDRYSPLLSVFGLPMFVGPLGSGASAKLVANSTLLGALTLLGEAIALGEGLGLPPALVFDVLAATPLAAQAERRRPAIESRDFPRRFSLALAHKDADLLNEAAAQAGLNARLLAAARDWFAEADAKGLGEEDYSAILAWIIDHATPPSP